MFFNRKVYIDPTTSKDIGNIIIFLKDALKAHFISV